MPLVQSCVKGRNACSTAVEVVPSSCQGRLPDVGMPSISPLPLPAQDIRLVQSRFICFPHVSLPSIGKQVMMTLSQTRCTLAVLFHHAHSGWQSTPGEYETELETTGAMVDVGLELFDGLRETIPNCALHVE